MFLPEAGGGGRRHQQRSPRWVIGSNKLSRSRIASHLDLRTSQMCSQLPPYGFFTITAIWLQVQPDVLFLVQLKYSACTAGAYWSYSLLLRGARSTYALLLHSPWEEETGSAAAWRRQVVELNREDWHKEVKKNTSIKCSKRLVEACVARYMYIYASIPIQTVALTKEFIMPNVSVAIRQPSSLPNYYSKPRYNRKWHRKGKAKCQVFGLCTLGACDHGCAGLAINRLVVYSWPRFLLMVWACCWIWQASRIHRCFRCGWDFASSQLMTCRVLAACSATAEFQTCPRVRVYLCSYSWCWISCMSTSTPSLGDMGNSAVAEHAANTRAQRMLQGNQSKKIMPAYDSCGDRSFTCTRGFLSVWWGLKCWGGLGFSWLITYVRDGDIGSWWGRIEGPVLVYGQDIYGHDTLRQPDVDTLSEPVTQSRGVVPGSCGPNGGGSDCGQVLQGCFEDKKRCSMEREDRCVLCDGGELEDVKRFVLEREEFWAG